MSEYFQIELTRGRVALVSADDFAEISRHKWYAHWSQTNQSFYAYRNARKENGKRFTVAMHRQIMGFPDGLEVDHIHGNTLDNRRSQLRLATHMDNARNSKTNCRNKSGFKGVSFIRGTGRWLSRIYVEKSPVHLGNFSTPEEAYTAYLEAADKYFGEFRRAA